ncbi:MAG: ABC transporter permease [Actinomycetota bacterium]|nr:ABC transporter permease [Actinomycetota bacterium]
MNRIDQIKIVAMREIVERSRSTVFRASIVGIALVVAGAIVVLSIIGGDDDPISVGLGGEILPGLEEDISSVAEAVETPITVSVYETEDALIHAVREESVDVGLVNSSTVVTNSGAGTTETVILSTAVNVAERRIVGAQIGLSDDQINAIVAPVSLEFTELEESQPEDDTRAVVALAGSVVLFMSIVMFGQFVAMGIVEEKQNRVVEVVLSRIDSTSLLVGKVIGIGLLGIAQVTVIVTSAILALVFSPSDGFAGVDLAAVGIPSFVALGFWFVLGYLMFSFVYAAFGATVSRLEDLQSVAFIPAMILLPGYFLVVFSVGGSVTPIVRAASFFPFWTPIVMPLRITRGDAQWWEVAVSIAIVFVTIWLIVRFAARVYRGAALRTGARVKILEAFRGTDG